MEAAGRSTERTCPRRRLRGRRRPQRTPSSERAALGRRPALPGSAVSIVEPRWPPPFAVALTGFVVGLAGIYVLFRGVREFTHDGHLWLGRVPGRTPVLRLSVSGPPREPEAGGWGWLPSSHARRRSSAEPGTKGSALQSPPTRSSSANATSSRQRGSTSASAVSSSERLARTRSNRPMGAGRATNGASAASCTGRSSQ